MHKEILNEIEALIEAHKKYSNLQGENFNIFSILRMERQEVETHSRFIYELLNPNGSHGQGSVFLDLFVQVALGLPESTNNRNPAREDVTQSNVRDRRIDFTLESNEFQIGVEMKIDAGDQSRQLYDYYKELDYRSAPEQQVKLFYLTLFGNEPSKSSVKSLINNDHYQCISFEDHIKNWIDACIDKSSRLHVLREALIQYSYLIEKLTFTNKEIEMEIVEALLSSPEKLHAGLAIEKSLNSVKAKVQFNFWQALENELRLIHERVCCFKVDKECTKNFSILTKEYYEGSRSNRHFGNLVKLGKLRDSECHLCFVVEVDWRVYSGFGLCRIENGAIKRVEKNEVSKEVISPLLELPGFNVDDKSKWFFDRKRFVQNNGEDISFYEFNSAAANLVDEETLLTVVKQYMAEVEPLLESVRKLEIVERNG